MGTHGALGCKSGVQELAHTVVRLLHLVRGQTRPRTGLAAGPLEPQCCMCRRRIWLGLKTGGWLQQLGTGWWALPGQLRLTVDLVWEAAHPVPLQPGWQGLHTCCTRAAGLSACVPCGKQLVYWSCSACQTSALATHSRPGLHSTGQGLSSPACAPHIDSTWAS